MVNAATAARLQRCGGRSSGLAARTGELKIASRRLGPVGVILGHGGGPAQALTGPVERVVIATGVQRHARRRGELDRALLLQFPLQAEVLLGQ